MKKVYVIFAMLGSVTAFAQNENVGIGTVSPEKSAVLDVSSTTKGFLTPRMTLNQRNAIVNPVEGLLVYQTDVVSGFYYFDGKIWSPFLGNTAALSVADANNWGLQGNSGTNPGFNYLGTTDAQPIIFRTNTANNTLYNERMRIGADGRIGIGTSSPSELLEVAGNIKGNILSSGSRTYLVGKDGAGFHWFASNPTISEPNNIMMGIKRDIATDFVTDLFLAPGGTFAVSIANTGKVKVGDVSTNPTGYNLFVQGGIMTEKVKVALASSGDWADYVFEDDYNRLSLEDVEKFIKKNKHLPHVPSTSEVLKNGLDLAKTDAKLLEKIEELTLYIIEINNRVKSLELENESLKKK